MCRRSPLSVRARERRDIYRLPPSGERITLEKIAWTAPEEVKIEGPDEKALVYRSWETIEWKVVGS